VTVANNAKLIRYSHSHNSLHNGLIMSCLAILAAMHWDSCLPQRVHSPLDAPVITTAPCVWTVNLDVDTLSNNTEVTSASTNRHETLCGAGGRATQPHTCVPSARAWCAQADVWGVKMSSILRRYLNDAILQDVIVCPKERAQSRKCLAKVRFNS
jgi:hypothetical protein